MPSSVNELQSMESLATFIAKVIYGAIDELDSKHQSDDQMDELDSIIRNAIYTALYASEHYLKSSAAKAFVTVNLASIPKHWEKPQPLDSYRRLEELHQEKRVQDTTTNKKEKRLQDSATNEIKPPIESKDGLIETIKHRGYEIRVHQYPWEPTFFFTVVFAENGKAQVAESLPNADAEYADAATAIRKTKAAIDGYLRKKKCPKTLLKRKRMATNNRDA